MRNRTQICFILIFLFVFRLGAQTLPMDLYEQGRRALAAGNHFASLDFFKQALAVNPSYVDARKGMAEVYFLLEEYQEALKHAELALKGSDSAVDILTLIGRIHLGLNRMEDAERFFQRALSIEPNNAEASYGKAEIAVFKGNYSEGTGLFERSLSINPDSRRALLSLTLLHEEAGDFARSDQYLNRALEHYPRDPRVMDFAIHYNIRREQWSSAEALAMKWQALDPENAAVSGLLGTIYNRMDQHEKAVLHYNAAVSRDQENPLLWYHLGRSYWNLGRYDQALLSFRTVNIIDPGDEMARIAKEHLLMTEYPIGHRERIKAGEFHYSEGETFRKLFQYEQAFHEFRKGRLLSPLDFDLWWSYAEIQKSLGYANRYRDEMAALKNEGYDNPRFLRLMELLESSEEPSFLNNWKGPIQYGSDPVRLSLYLDSAESSLIHTGIEDSVLYAVSNQIKRNPRFEIQNRSIVTDSSQAYRTSHRDGSDFYILFTMTETERTLRMKGSVYLSRSGTELFSFHILRSGKRRVNELLLKGAGIVMQSLPLKGELMGIEKDSVLVNLGWIDGIAEEDNFILLRQGSGRWSDEKPYIEFSNDDLLGQVQVQELQENYLIGSLKRNSPFDLVNAGDEIYILPEDIAIPELTPGAVNEELKSQLLKLY